jgi:hypothetical protein
MQQQPADMHACYNRNPAEEKIRVEGGRNEPHYAPSSLEASLDKKVTNQAPRHCQHHPSQPQHRQRSSRLGSFLASQNGSNKNSSSRTAATDQVEYVESRNQASKQDRNISSHQPHNRQTKQYKTKIDYFSRLDTTLFSLFEMMTLKWADVLRDVHSVYQCGWGIFGTFLVFTSFILYSLIVAEALTSKPSFAPSMIVD